MKCGGALDCYTNTYTTRTCAPLSYMVAAFWLSTFLPLKLNSRTADNTWRDRLIPLGFIRPGVPITKLPLFTTPLNGIRHHAVERESD